LSALVHGVLLVSGGFSWIRTFSAPPSGQALRIQLLSVAPKARTARQTVAVAQRPPARPPARQAQPGSPAATLRPAPAPEPPRTPPSGHTPALSLQNLLTQAGDFATQQNDETSAINAQNGRLIYGASARGLQWAQYIDDWVKRMERVGRINFPENVRSLGLSGGPTLRVVINADGSLESLRIARSSGNSALDQATEGFVRSMAPFAPFPPELAQQGRSLEFQRKWTFSTDNDVSVQ
jgi:protein TonB